MKENLTNDELIGNFEAWKEEEDKEASLKAQAKLIKDKLGDTITDYAKDIEVKAADIKDAYKYWKERKFKGKEPSDEVYTLRAIVDEEIDDGEEAEE